MAHIDTLEILNELIEILEQIVDTQKGTIEAQKRTINNYEELNEWHNKIYQQQSDAWFGIFDTLNHVGIGDFTKSETPKGLQGIDDFNYSLVSKCADIAWQKHAKLENLMAKLKGKPDVY